MITIDALDVLCVQLTRDLFAIAKFLSALAKVTARTESKDFPVLTL